MRRFKLFRWVAVLTLAIALAPGAASAQEADTLTISSTFNMDWLDGTVGPDLAEVYANGHEHTWTLTLHGTTHSHSTFWLFGVYYATEIHATSFDLEFFGPDAATLNGIVSDHIAGGDVLIYLENAYSSASAATSRSCTSGRRVPTWTSTQATTWESIRSSRPTRTATPSWGRNRSRSGPSTPS